MQTKFIKALATAAVIAAAFGAQSSYAGQRVIKIDGSSTVYPISEAVAEAVSYTHLTLPTICSV